MTDPLLGSLPTEPKADNQAFVARDEADAKAWFYLDHRHDIEEWAALRSDGRLLLEKYLLGMSERLARFASFVGAEIGTRQLEEGRWPSMFLTRSTWTGGSGTATNQPDVDIAFQWDRSGLLRPGVNEWPYVAVRVDENGLDPKRRASLVDAVLPARSEFTRRPLEGYLCWEYVRQPAGAVDPAGLLDNAMAAIQRLWELAAPALDTLHERTP